VLSKEVKPTDQADCKQT